MAGLVRLDGCNQAAKRCCYLLQQAASPAAGSISFASLAPSAPPSVPLASVPIGGAQSVGVPVLSGLTADTRSGASRGSGGRGSGAELTALPAGSAGGDACAATAAAAVGGKAQGAAAVAELTDSLVLVEAACHVPGNRLGM